MPRADLPDYYAILGVEQSATTAEVKSAYRQLSRSAHPDAGGNPALFRMISLAYDTLKDPDAREEYDRSLGSTGTNATPSGYTEEDLNAALREQEVLMRQQMESEMLSWATRQSSVPHTTPPVQAVEPEFSPADEERILKRMRAWSYFATVSVFALAYLLRSVGALSFLAPTEGFLATSTEFFTGFNITVLLLFVGAGVALEHYLAPFMRTFDVPNPWLRSGVRGFLLLAVLLGEYLSTLPAQLILGVGVLVSLAPMLLPPAVRSRFFRLYIPRSVLRKMS